MAAWTAADIEAGEGSETLDLPAELQPAVTAFLIAASQWRWSGGMVPFRTGLDYAGLRAGCAMTRLRLSPEDFEGVRIMEAHALSLFARKEA